MYWATFLPLSKPLIEVQGDLDKDYTLLLHGDFFVDPGRNHPDFDSVESPEEDRNERDLRQAWNRHLTSRL